MEKRDTKWYFSMAKKINDARSEIKHEIHVWRLKHDFAYKTSCILITGLAFLSGLNYPRLPQFKNKPIKK